MSLSREAEIKAFLAVMEHPQKDAVVAVASIALEPLFRTRSFVWSAPTTIVRLAEEHGLGSTAPTAFGDCLAVLSRPPEGDAECALARALYAHVLRASCTGKPTSQSARLAANLLWMATNTPFDALGLVEPVFGPAADEVWRAIIATIRAIDNGEGGALGRAEALVGAASLAERESAEASAETVELASVVRDRSLANVLRASARTGAPLVLAGDGRPAPRPVWATLIVGATGLLAILHLWRVVARAAFGIRRRLTLRLDTAGIQIDESTTLFGRPFRHVESRFPESFVVGIGRDAGASTVRALAPLAAFALGSAIGMAVVTDGTRAASPPLVAKGIAIIGLGFVAELLLGSTLLAGRRVSVLTIATRDRRKFRMAVADEAAISALLQRFGANEPERVSPADSTD